MRFRQILILALAVLPALTGCVFNHLDPDKEPDRFSNVVILYTAAYNDLSSDIQQNINTICETPLPMKNSSKALLLVSHRSVNDADFKTPTEPLIIRMYSDWSGSAVMDTLKRLGPKEQILDKDVMHSCLAYIQDNFKSDHYGIVFSSHGTGWLPEGYYSAPVSKAASGGPKLKSFGVSAEVSMGHRVSHEMIVQDMAKAIPMHLDYIIFDACLMGGIEVAYELRGITDVIGFSPAEILSTGFNYSALSEDLVANISPQRFCERYYEYYNSLSGSSKSATISLVDCSKLEGLANVCAKMFERYRDGIASVNPKNVQGFFTSGKHWFYDLEDILVNAGISQADRSELSSAIDGCIVYKAHTNTLFAGEQKKEFPIRTFCGLSSYLPCNGSRYLDAFYKELAWNKATGLVE